MAPNRIFFDLDGVFRDVNKVVYGFEPETWNERHPESGQTFLEIINEEPELLLKAPPLPYLFAVLDIMSQYDINIATCQYESWKPYTERWLNQYVPNSKVYWFHGRDGRKKNDFCVNTQCGILVEDSPALQDYTSVIIIDHPYNKHVWAKEGRVYSPEQLQKVLQKWL